MRFATRFAAALALAAALAAPAAAQGDAFRRVAVSGRVVDAASGRPLAAARVQLGESGPTVSTDESGAFRFDRVTVGTRTFLVYRLGYRDAEARVEVAEGLAPLELRLEADPLILEGLQVNVDIFETRRNASAAPVRVVREDELLYTSAPTAADFLADRGIRTESCNAPRGECIRTRGSLYAIDVYVDEELAVGGTGQLRVLRPEEVYMIEIFRGGRQVRVYTNAFMEREAKRGFRPFPIFL